MLQQGPITHRARRIISSRPAETIHFNILDSLRLEQACKERDILRENIIYYQNATTKLSFIGFRPTISGCLQLGKKHLIEFRDTKDATAHMGHSFRH